MTLHLFISREAWCAINHGVAKSQTWLSDRIHNTHVDGQLGCFHLLPRVDNAAMSMGVQTPLCPRLDWRLYIYIYLQKWNRWMMWYILFLTLGIATLFPKVDAPFTSPPVAHKSSSFSTFSYQHFLLFLSYLHHPLSRHLHKSCHIQDAGASVRSKTDSCLPWSSLQPDT